MPLYAKADTLDWHGSQPWEPVGPKIVERGGFLKGFGGFNGNLSLGVLVSQRLANCETLRRVAIVRTSSLFLLGSSGSGRIRNISFLDGGAPRGLLGAFQISQGKPSHLPLFSTLGSFPLLRKLYHICRPLPVRKCVLALHL